ncbi:hypothetical protein [Lentzea sp.]|uniref:hypothetical protein n=1 Tax=Lentzea sp. TaxID=56099 RepID=UPI002BC900C0|nr:hypothetical protein [Lentzea sp.]HUQ59368.1 hypothetical protein [Lentzea sp.]
MEAVTSQDSSIDDNDPRIWHADYTKPVHDKAFVIDAKIEPGQVVWVGITLEGGARLGTDFCVPSGLRRDRADGRGGRRPVMPSAVRRAIVMTDSRQRAGS